MCFFLNQGYKSDYLGNLKKYIHPRYPFHGVCIMCMSSFRSTLPQISANANPTESNLIPSNSHPITKTTNLNDVKESERPWIKVQIVTVVLSNGVNLAQDSNQFSISFSGPPTAKQSIAPCWNRSEVKFAAIFSLYTLMSLPSYLFVDLIQCSGSESCIDKWLLHPPHTIFSILFQKILGITSKQYASRKPQTYHLTIHGPRKESDL